MRERELRAAAECAICHEKIGASQLPLFWRLRIERHGIKLDAVRRQAGLEAVLGGAVAIAQVLGPDEEMTEVLMVKEITVCERCGVERPIATAALVLES